MAQRDIRRILVIRRKALGDVLVTLPAIVELSAAYPRAQLDLVVDRPYADLVDRLAHGVEVLPWPPMSRPAVTWLSRLRAASYDLVLDYLGSPRTAMWTALSGAPLRVGYELRGRAWAYNLRVPRNAQDGLALRAFAGEAFLDPLRALGLAPRPWRTGRVLPVFDSALGAGYRAWVAGYRRGSGPRVGLVFSATWSAKAWPAREADRLYGLLVAGGMAPLFITGPGDQSLEASLRRSRPDTAFAPPTNLLELAHLLSGLDLCVGTDSGARHLAALLGIPTVTLFGPTDPIGWNPADPRHVAMRTGEPCSPCNLTTCPIPGHPCLDGLGAERVLAVIHRQLARIVPRGRDDKGA
jgi:ADP-heptose:LPS heptosyltransferase